MRSRVSLAVASAALLAALVFAAQASSETPAACKHGERRAVEVGIVKAVACWTQVGESNETVWQAAYADQPEGIDLNGFVLTGPEGGALRINPNKHTVYTIAITAGVNLEQAQLNSRNWPVPGKLTPIGGRIPINFEAPEKGEVLLEDLRFGSGSGIARALDGLSPLGDTETPVKIEEDGKGSMDLTVQLAGAFSLKGKAQSATVVLPTESEKGTKLDGFEVSLEEIDALKIVTLNEFEAKYSAAEKTLAGKAVVTFPFSGPGKKGYGFGGAFAIEDGALTEGQLQVKGTHIPVGAPPGGFITTVGGGFKLKNEAGNKFTMLLLANAEAEFGPEIPTPWGKVAPITVNAALQLGHVREELFFEVKGGVKVFRLPVGDVRLAIHSAGGVDFGVGLGIGFPSYRNNDNDPFYIGARVEGWVAKGKFQFEGSGRVALLGMRIFDGRVLVNNRAAGACWKVLGLDGGAVYVYGASEVKTFGIGCGLDSYKEKMPQGARISAVGDGARTIELGPGESTLAVQGRGAAPQFTLSDGRGHVLHTPGIDPSVVQRHGFRHAFFVNQGTNTTYVLLPHPQGTWTVTPNHGSAAIVALKAAKQAADERVTAEVRGNGRERTLVWHSLNRPHTRLLFTEILPNGAEVPILETGKAGGRKRFRVTPGVYRGQRKLHVVVVDGYASRQDAVADRFAVHRPRPLPPARHVEAWRDEHTVHVRWSPVPGARSYLVQVAVLSRDGKPLANFVRHVSAKRHGLSIPSYPGGPRAVAKVQAIDWGGGLGRVGHDHFRTNPRRTSMNQAADAAAASAFRRGDGVVVESRCPREGGHCRVAVILRYRGKVVASRHFQQTPDTFDRLIIRPRSRSVREAFRRGGRATVTVRSHRDRAARGAVASNSFGA